jgi:hypothetical protein
MVSPIATFFTRKAELSAQSHQLQLQINDAQAKRQIDLISQGRADDASWEMQSLKNAGWRGSFELIVLTIPVVMCFIPGLVQYVQAGFAALDKTPIWFQWLLVMIYAANYGIRTWRRNQSDT